MSHFSCIVITDSEPKDGELERILQPWHEFECTGCDDEYVVDVDVTDKVVHEFNKPQKVVILADGTICDWHDDRFYHDNGKEGFEKGQEYKLPEGAEEKEFTADKARAHGVGHATMAAAAEAEYGEGGLTEREGRWYDRTNPNAKWDWWQVGGRWTGMLVPDYDPNKDPDNIQTCELCGGRGLRYELVKLKNEEAKFEALKNELITLQKENDSTNPRYLEVVREMRDILKCNGCDGKGKRVKWPTGWKPIPGDQSRWGDVPIEALRDLAERKELETYDKVHAVLNGRELPSWKAMTEKYPNGEEARKAWWEHPVIKDLKAALDDNIWILMGSELEKYQVDRLIFALKARANAAIPFAIVKDGKWYEKGSMGWFACVADEKGDWAEEAAKLFDSLSPDNWVSVVDMHI